LVAGCGARPTPAPAPVPSATPAVARDTTRPHDTTAVRDSAKRFYANRQAGSEVQFNPVSLVINGGYDQLRTGNTRQVFRLPYRTAAANVFRSVANPVPVLGRYGWGRWLRDEVFPLTTRGQGGGQWYPNYQLHLFAGGMSYVRISEWYAQHGVGRPRLAGGFTMYAWHLLTEMIENGGRVGDNEDALTDLLIFDSGAIVLWNNDWMQRAFSDHIQMTLWPGQPSLSLSDGTIQNAFMTAMLRAPIPRVERWRAFTTMGASFLVGVSHRRGNDLWFSLGGGFDPASNPIIDPATGRKSVTLLPNIGIFVDRDGSLLGSLLANGGSDVLAGVNLYPRVVHLGPFSPGIWAQALRDGGFRIGLASRWGVGVGVPAR
jgi:hypothetical protein